MTDIIPGWEVQSTLIERASAVDSGIILLTRTGSRAYGTDHADSDHDFRGVMECTKERFYSLSGAPKSIDVSNPHDAVAYELRHFCQLASKCNPTALEVLWGDDYDACCKGEALRENREIFLSKKIIHSYGGYAMGQLRKAQEGTGGSRGQNHHKRIKFRLHTLRLLHAGIHALDHGEVMVRVPHPDLLWDAARGDNWADTARALDLEMKRAAATTSLPDEPDYAAINKLMYYMREDLL